MAAQGGRGVSLDAFRTHLDAFLFNLFQQVTSPGQEGWVRESPEVLPKPNSSGFP